MPDEPLDDLSLLRRTAGGDRAAFEHFVVRHQAAVLRFSEALAKSREDAEDVLQETFLTAWRKAAGFSGRGSARSWLLTIARRKVYRSTRRPRPRPAGDAVSLEELAVQAGWGRCDRSGAEDLDDRVLLHQAFSRLAPGDREILLLRDLEGLSAAETGQVLGLGIPAAKSRLHRARLRLIAQLDEGASHGE